MTMQAILERELVVAARRNATYRNRLITPLALAGLGLAIVVFNGASGSPKLAGAGLFHALSYVTVGFCVLEGMRKTADSLSQERREGTLGLLLLTQLKSGDVILGKLASTSLTSFYALFAMLPILAWSLLLGGVTLGEVWRVGLGATSLLLFSLSAGIWVSARSRSAVNAMIGTMLLVLLPIALFLLPGINRFAVLDPACAFLHATNANYFMHATAFWFSLLITPFFSWMLLANAAAAVTHFRDADGAVEEKVGSSKSSRARNTKSEKRWLDLNPICWLAHRDQLPPALVWLIAVVGGMGIALLALGESFWRKKYLPVGAAASGWTSTDLFLLIFVIIINACMKTLVAAQASRCLAEARRNVTLELLLCAPLNVMDILLGQILALRRTFLPPLLVLLAFEMMGLFLVVSAHPAVVSGYHQRDESLNAVLFSEAAFVFYVLIDFQAVAWAGMWFGLCSRNESRATFKTVFYVILLPHLLLIFFCLGIALFLLWPIVALVWSRLNLQEHFRALAGSRLNSTGDLNGWVPFEIPDMTKEEPFRV